MGRPITKPCGTIAAYKRHLRHGDTPCDRCKAANATWHREYQAEKRDELL
jgi:hypothetical protein